MHIWRSLIKSHMFSYITYETTCQIDPNSKHMNLWVSHISTRMFQYIRRIGHAPGDSALFNTSFKRMPTILNVHPDELPVLTSFAKEKKSHTNSLNY